MPKINQEEYEVLKGLDDKWKWIARDEDSASVEIFQAKPYKVGTVWMWEGYTCIDDIEDTKLFQFIQWEDEKPYNIQELIEEYEYSTVKKDLKEAILGIEVTQFDGQKTDLEELVNPKQLEKIISDWMPEVLTQEWIDENITQDDIKGNGYVAADALYGLLVPKQEEVDRAYRKGFKEGERQTAEYFESITEEPSKEQVWKYLSEHGIEVVDKEPETVASVIADFYKSLERLKEVLGTKVKELEE